MLKYGHFVEEYVEIEHYDKEQKQWVKLDILDWFALGNNKTQFTQVYKKD